MKLNKTIQSRKRKATLLRAWYSKLPNYCHLHLGRNSQTDLEVERFPEENGKVSGGRYPEASGWDGLTPRVASFEVAWDCMADSGDFKDGNED